jgi:hypothetical protein
MPRSAALPGRGSFASQLVSGVGSLWREYLEKEQSDLLFSQIFSVVCRWFGNPTVWRKNAPTTEAVARLGAQSRDKNLAAFRGSALQASV